MKKILLILCLISNIAYGKSFPIPFVKDTHYKVLEERKLTKNEILEIYSVYCKACYAYEKTAFKTIKKSLSKDVSFKEIHIIGMGKFLSSPAFLLKNSKDYEKTKMVLFETLHDKNIDSISDFLDIVLEKEGLSKQDYEALSKNAKFEQEINEDEKKGKEIAKIYGIPAILINNRYLINLKKINTLGELSLLINYLLSLDEGVANQDQSNDGA
ncbi:MAG: Thiol:disulfide interchange protein DsbL precursor [Alphaproteobacteria bacterium ADurb.Bin438]|nr:MAG: Thiol:disulfide interchange protein DsbL precursor [Alphaproteobacteria bacterium ADurb.Bin438]